MFIACISKLSDEDIRREVMPEVIVNGGLSQPSSQRVWCGRILGAAAAKLDAKRVEQQIFPKASQLCQDTDYEVRRAMCKELAAMVKSMGYDLCLNPE